MYQALYRKYRPRTFDDVSGQEHITRTLKNQVASDRCSHAYLFVGTRGTGKTSCAKILARAINCEHPVDGSPCNECAPCRAIESGAAMDVVEMDAASNNGVGDVRALRDEAIFSPAALKKRVYIIDEVHMLSKEAFNALLKILEEPPEHLIFVLATTELYKVPATIVSRCQRFSFHRLTREAIDARLRFVASAEGVALSDDASATLARLADGSMRDGLSLLDQCAGEGDVTLGRVRELVGLPEGDAAASLLRAVAARDAGGAFSILDSLYRGGTGISALFDELSELARDALVLKFMAGGENLLSGAADTKELKALGAAFGEARLLYALTALSKARRELTRGAGDRLAAELCIASLCDERLESYPEALTARVEALEGGRSVRDDEGERGNGSSRTPTPTRTEETPPLSAAPTSPPPSGGDEEDEAPWAEEEPTGDGAGAITCAPRGTNRPKTDAETENDGEEDEEEPVGAGLTRPETGDDGEDDGSSRTPTPTETKDDGFWDEILARLEVSGGIMVLPFVSDATAALTGDILTVTVTDSFAVEMLARESAAAMLKAAAEEIIGRQVALKTVVGENKGAAEKLGDLSSRLGDIIRFDE
ncbi:MAG: DNA polymerase III subunit gamma/tau [Oscillospiraceae bacterium]|nr:DNA polymerase III subunit gamma/tau [Oscillospiraceae bacterium]